MVLNTVYIYFIIMKKEYFYFYIIILYFNKSNTKIFDLCTIINSNITYTSTFDLMSRHRLPMLTENLFLKEHFCTEPYIYLNGTTWLYFRPLSIINCYITNHINGLLSEKGTYFSQIVFNLEQLMCKVLSISNRDYF